MHSYCPECFSNLEDRGIALSVYLMIAEAYSVHWVPLALRDPHIWNQVLHYLESDGYILTTEAEENYVYARPYYYKTYEDCGIMFCSGRCEFSKIDFNAECE